MAAPGFGFSIGDFIAGGQILIQVIKAFKEAGGASAKYAAEVSFLNSLKATLDHLEKFVSSNSSSQGPQDNELPEDISRLLQNIRGPWQEFKTFLDKYEPSLGAASSKSKLAKAPRTIQYTVKDISGKVDKLRQQTEQPLQAVNSLLSLHVIKSLEKLPGQLLRPAQCAQLVEAITLADIPTELDKQIRQLKLAADAHNVKQDEQLQTITTLRAQLEERLQGLQEVVEVVRGPDLAANGRHDEQLEASKLVHSRVDRLSEVLESRTDQLESELKGQKQLMLAMKSFLEDKTSISQSLSESGKQRAKESIKQSSWPSSTLSTAYFAALMLSSVLSSVAVNSIVTRPKRSFIGGTQRLVSPSVEYSLPGLGAMNKIQVPQSLMKEFAATREIALASKATTSTQAKTSPPKTTVEGMTTSSQATLKSSTPAKPSQWVDDYRRTQLAVRQPEERRTRPERGGQVGGFSMGPGINGGSPLSKLNHDDDKDSSDHDAPATGKPTGEPDGGFRTGPGPMIPSMSSDNQNPSWETASSSSGGYGGGGYGSDSS